MLNFLTESIENETNTDLVYLDFAKAFDSVPHKRLICKLQNYGISGNLLLLIRNFYHIEDNKLEETPPDQIGKTLLVVYTKVTYLDQCCL